MNKQAYLDALKESLRDLPIHEVDAILYDINERFLLGIQEGQSEEIIIAQLGTPLQLSAQYLNEINPSAQATPVLEPAAQVAPSQATPSNYSPQRYVESKKTNVLLLMLLIFLNLTFVLGPYIGVWGALIGFFFAAFGMILAGGLIGIVSFAPNGLYAVIHVPHTFSYEPMGVFAFGVGICCMGLLLFIGTSYVSELVVKITGKYMGWMKSLI